MNIKQLKKGLSLSDEDIAKMFKLKNAQTYRCSSAKDRYENALCEFYELIKINQDKKNDNLLGAGYYRCIKNNNDFRLFDDMMYVISNNVIVYPNGDSKAIPSVDFLNRHFVKSDYIAFCRYHRGIYGADASKSSFHKGSSFRGECGDEVIVNKDSKVISEVKPLHIFKSATKQECKDMSDKLTSRWLEDNPEKSINDYEDMTREGVEFLRKIADNE